MYKIRRMGIDSAHDKNFSINRPSGYDCYLVLYVKSKAQFEIGDSTVITEPNTLIIYNVNTPHQYESQDDIYVNDWIQIESNSIFDVPFDTPLHIGDKIAVSAYMKLIFDAYYRNDNMAYALLLRALFHEVSEVFGNIAHRSAYSSALLTLRKEIYSHPEAEWNVQSMADKIHVSEAYFQELYKTAFGISCIADVIYSRIETAKELLTDTDYSITCIGSMCGYNSSVHFSRQFKKIMKCTPSEYKRNFRKS